MSFYPDTSDLAISTEYNTVASVVAGAAVPAHTPHELLVVANSGEARQKWMVVLSTEYRASKLHSQMLIKKENIFVNSRGLLFD